MKLKKALFSFIRVVLILLISLALFEVVYRMLPASVIYGTDYQNLHSEGVMNEGGFLKPDINTWVANSYGEKVRWITNSKGFRNEKEISLKKPANTLRIFSLGDSYTAGYRVGQTETFSYLLERTLNSNAKSKNYEVVVANIEDPVNGLVYLEKYGLKYRPDVILLGITIGNDLTQTFANLNPYGKYILENDQVKENKNFSKEKLSAVMDEKFPSGACNEHFNASNLWDKLVAVKYLKQIFGSSTGGESIFACKSKAHPYLHDYGHALGLFLKQPPASIEQTFGDLDRVLFAYKKMTEENNLKLIVCIFPQRFQINPFDWEKTVEDYGLNESYFDRSIPNKKIHSICTKNNIECIDVTDDLKTEYGKNKQNLYLPMGDMHWNKFGHRAVCHSVYRQLKLKR